MNKKIALFLTLCIAVTGFSACTSQTQTTINSEISVAQSQDENIPNNETSIEDSSISETTQSQTESTPESSPTVSEISSVSTITSSSDSTVSQTESDTPSTSSHETGNTTSQVSTNHQTSSQTSTSNSNVQTESSVNVSTPSQPAQPSKTDTSHSQNTTPSTPSAEPSKIPQNSQSATQQSSVTENSRQETAPSTPTTPTNENDIGGINLYNELFKIENKVTVDISMSQSEIDKLQADYQKYTASDENKKSPIYRMATVTFTIGSQKYTVDEVGIRLKGNQSLRPFYSNNGTPNICSFKLSFDETFDDKTEYGSSAKVWSDDSARKARKKRKFATLNELDIKWNISYDNTNIREVYATKLFESANVLVQKIGLSQMKINGNNYGLVKIYEPIDKTFLEKRLPESAIGGDLYKCMWSEYNNSGNRTGWWRGATYKTDNSYGIQDNATGKKFNFNLKTNKSSSKHEQLKNFLNVINKSNLTKTDLENVLDVDYYANFMAATYFAGDPDDIRNNYNNHYIYFRKDNGKAIFIVYDNDRTLGITYGLNKNCATRNPYSSYAATQSEQENPLIKKTISHDALSNLSYVRDKYTAALKKLSQTEMLTSDTDFNKMYNTAKANYESIITPYIKFANQKETFKFSLDGNKNGGDTSNMSFEQFRSQIMATYQSAKP